MSRRRSLRSSKRDPSTRWQNQGVPARTAGVLRSSDFTGPQQWGGGGLFAELRPVAATNCCASLCGDENNHRGRFYPRRAGVGEGGSDEKRSLAKHHSRAWKYRRAHPGELRAQRPDSRARRRAAGPSDDDGSRRSDAAPALPVLSISPSKPTVGSEVRATAEGLPANRSVELIWKTVQGGWVIEDYYHFRGKKFSETGRSLGHARVGPDGHLDAWFTIPEDYGGIHDVLVAADGAPLAQGGVEIVQTFEIRPTEGPIGTPIEVRAKGLGWRTMESTWVVNWDNNEVGWVSAVNTRGTAVARFRATGPVGEHVIKLYSGYMGQSYLNYEQAPTAYLPRPQFTFRTTPGGSGSAAYTESLSTPASPSVRESDRGASGGEPNPRASADPGDTARRGFTGEHISRARLGDVGRQSRDSEWLCAKGDTAGRAERRRGGAARGAREQSRTTSEGCTRWCSKPRILYWPARTL